jgi:enoyl-CoA hydratase/carnithine racemase
MNMNLNFKNADGLQINYDEEYAIVSIDRTSRRNSMDQILVDGLKSAFLDLDKDSSVKAIILQGRESGFCAGSDLKFISAIDLEQMARFEQECGDLGRLMGFISKPVIGAVENYAIGGGFILAACCDIVVAGAGSQWSLPEVPLGWITPWGLKPLVERVGNVRARNLCFCLEPLNGDEAGKIGLADYVVPDGTVKEKAVAIARKIAGLPQPAVRSVKRFFSTPILRDAEVFDFEANRLFVENSREGDAMKTFAKLKSKV